MKKVLTSDQMRTMERAYFATGVSSISLMERAARCLANELAALPESENMTCVFACGPGGNGGDGYAAARIFAQNGGRAVLLPVMPPRTPDAIENFNRALPHVFGTVSPHELDRLPRPAIWVDCIFGIGANRAPEGDIARVIRRMNADRACGSKIISADIPSGLNADTGTCFTDTIRADVTVAFQCLKRGHLIGSGMEYCGKTVCRSIGIPDEFLPEDAADLVENSDIPKALPVRGRCAHKNTFGHLLIVAGSFGMAGAAAICAQSAMRAGAGLTSIACPESVVPILQTLAPCAMCIPLPEENGAMSARAASLLEAALAGKSAVAIGPGLSMRAAPECVKVVLKSGLKTVIDADALNIISAHEELKKLLTDRHALTPHPGEAARLTGISTISAFESAALLKALGAFALVKGAGSVILGSRAYISVSGCSGMAKGGSGDALTGIVGALLAQGTDPETALWLGSEIHGRAGEIAARRYGERAMLPTDLIQCLGEAMSDRS